MFEKKTILEQDRQETIGIISSLLDFSYEEYKDAIKQDFLCRHFLRLGVLSKRWDIEIRDLYKKLQEWHMKTHSLEIQKEKEDELLKKIYEEKQKIAQRDWGNADIMYFQKIWYKKTKEWAVMLIWVPYEEWYKTKVLWATIVLERETPELFKKINLNNRI